MKRKVKIYIVNNKCSLWHGVLASQRQVDQCHVFQPKFDGAVSTRHVNVVCTCGM